jgi:hypothetical protein
MTWVIDSSQFDSLGPARRMAEYMGEVISAASSSPPGRWKQSAIRCRRRPKHRRCLGRIQVRDASDDSIEWICPVCQDHGVIYNWKGSPYDLSKFREQGEQPNFEVILTEQEYDELKKCLVMDPEGDRIIYGATYTSKGIILRASGENLDDFAGYLAFEVNHEENRGRQRVLERVLDRVEAVLGKWSPS